MAGTDMSPRRFSHYSMEIECPQCGKKMILHVGLIGDPKNNSLRCLGCQKEIVPLVPGPIIGGPFPLTN
jgi:hypothetical protein